MAYTVYSNFSGQVRLLFWGVYRKLEEPGPWAEPVYSKIQSPGRLLVPSVYKRIERLGQGEIGILKNTGIQLVIGPGRISDNRQNWAQTSMR